MRERLAVMTSRGVLLLSSLLLTSCASLVPGDYLVSKSELDRAAIKCSSRDLI